MTKEQMEKALADVVLLEKDLMRDLTEEEANLVCDKGFKALFEKLEFDDEDFKTLRALRQLISSFCTLSIDDYETELMKDNYAAADVLETILHDLRDIEKKKCVSSTVKIGSETDLGTKIKVSDKPNQCDHGYLESEDIELNSYFSKESTEEANEAVGSYNPELDKDLFKSSDLVSEYNRVFETLTAPKDECSSNPYIYKGYSLEDLIDAFKENKIKSIELSDEEAADVFDFVAKNYNNFSFKNINGKVSIKIKD